MVTLLNFTCIDAKNIVVEERAIGFGERKKTQNFVSSINMVSLGFIGPPLKF